MQHTDSSVFGTQGAGHSTFPLVDALRAFAALLVVSYHVIVLTPWDVTLTQGALLLTHMGWIGVDFFFVISGFVIALNALRDYKQSPAVFGRSFAIRRFFRIAPLYFLTSILFVLVVNRELLSATPRDQLVQFATHIFFIHNLHASTAGTINGPSWSIGLEVQFYLLFALMLPWIARASIARLLAMFVLAALAYRYIVSLILVPGEASAHLQQIYTVQLPGTLDAFGLGIAIALAITRKAGSLSRNLLPTWTNFCVWLALAYGTSLAVWTFYWSWPDYWDSISMILFWRTLLAMSFACWLACALTLPIARHAIFRPLIYLGTISYGIYLWHMLVLLSLMKLPSLGPLPIMFGTMAGAIVLAALSWHLFERPLLQRAKQWTIPRRTASSTPPRTR